MILQGLQEDPKSESQTNKAHVVCKADWISTVS